MAPKRVRQSNAAPPSSAARTIELPPYEPPAFPLTPAAQRALAQLRLTHNLDKLNENMKEAMAALTNSAGDINERLAEREKRASKNRAAAAAQSDSPTAGGEDGGEGSHQLSLEELRDKVTRMTQRMDDSMRMLIDGQHSMQSVQDGLASVSAETMRNAGTQAGTQRVRSQGSRSRRRRQREDGEEADSEDEDEDAEHENEEEDEEEEYQDFDPTDPAAQQPSQIAPPIELFRSKLEEAKTQYESKSLAERYGDNNDYRDFYRMVHTSRHPDKDVPHHSTWFGEDSSSSSAPAPGVTTRARTGGADGGGEDSDDDIAVARATISTKCPLTLQEFREPLTSTKCPHSFEKAAILEMISMNRLGGQPDRNGNLTIGGVPGVKCPVSGCSQELTERDLHSDPVLKRKIQRLQRARELEDDEDEDDEGGDGAPGTQGKAQVIMDDEEDGDGTNVDDLLND